MMRMTDMVKHLLIINIIFFIGTYLVPQAQELLALHYLESEKFKIWQPLTYMFMHGGIGHIFFNMFALLSFGSVLEEYWGSKKFLFFYFSCGIGAMLVQSGVNYFEFHHLLNSIGIDFNGNDLKSIVSAEMRNGIYFDPNLFLNNTQLYLEKYNVNPEQFGNLFEMAVINQKTSVGASGAIYGLLVAFAFMFPNAELALMFIPVPIKAKYFVPGWILLFDVIYGIFGKYLGFGGSGFGHIAHIGGALVGFIMVYYWRKNQFDKNRWDR